MHGYQNTSVYYDFEERFDQPSFKTWMLKNSQHSWSCSVIYVIVIFGVKWYMQDRKRFNLRMPLAAWSGLLALFSIFGAYRTVPNLYNAITTHGMIYSFCDRGFLIEPPVSFWCAAFTLSKAYELGDTLFIVLRKQKLIFLHWYHHITVLLYVWLNYPSLPGHGRWFMTLNYTVHAFMYTYYTLRALRFNIPKWVNIAITFFQLLQMVIGMFINVSAYNIMESGQPCDNSYSNVKWAILMYLSYFVLFANFFYSAYLKPGDKPSHREKYAEKQCYSDGTAANGDVGMNGSIKHKKHQ